MNSLMVFDEYWGLQMQSISSCSNSIVASGVPAIGVAGARSVDGTSVDATDSSVAGATSADAAAFDADFRAGISIKKTKITKGFQFIMLNAFFG
jgi:hypothetical protein